MPSLYCERHGQAHSPGGITCRHREMQIAQERRLSQSAAELLREKRAEEGRELFEANPLHLVPPRGFRYIPFRDYASEPEKTLSVQESSLATERKLWVGDSEGARMHLSEDVVRQLRDVLTAWLDDPDGH